MKFKGQTVKGPKKQYSLKQQLGQGGFSVIYTTSDQDIICKVQVLSNPQISKAYKNEKQALQTLQHKNIVQLKDCFQIKQKDGSFGFLFLQNCSSGNAFNVLQSYGQNDVPQKLVLKIFYYVASALDYMHKKQIAHRDIKLQNVLITSKGQYKLCDFGSSSKQVIRSIDKQSRADIEEFIQRTTTPLYRSPEQLDLYSGYQIGTKVDIFALGVMIFMLCFKKQPFQSRLSAINNQYFIPQQTSYSSELISLIQKCFVTNPKQRITAQQLKKQIIQLRDKKVAQIQINLQRQFDSTLSQILKINNQMLKKSNQVAESSIFDKIKRIYNQITTQTQGWIASFVQDNQQAPQLKYNRSIISKCWQKRYKVQKMYEILFKYCDDYKNKSLVNLKLLILLHNFLRKGPPQSISYDGASSPSKICTKIYKNWKLNQRLTDSQDIKRNSYVCLVIRYYSLIIAAKWRLCYQNSEIIEGNFSILPFFQSKKQLALLKLPLICDLIKFIEMCAQFHEILATHSYLIQIQRSIILSLVDEQYCCISLTVFLICAFKQAICHLHEQLDMQKLRKKLRSIQRDFQEVFNKITKLFQSASKLASLFQQQTPFLLNNKILDHIKSIDINQKKSGNFQFKKHINYQKSIYGLKIPLSYEEAVKNPNFLKSLQRKDDLNVIEMNQFKIKKQSQNQKTQKQTKNQSINQAPIVTSPNNNTTNQPFKKNKQNKIFTNQNPADNKNIQTVSNLKKFSSKQDNSKSQKQDLKNANSFKTNNPMLMQFTHQNLNSDMNLNMQNNQSSTNIQQNTINSSKNEKQQSKPAIFKPTTPKNQNSFKDFLSIVDDKYNQSNGLLNKSQNDNKISQKFTNENIFKENNSKQLKKSQSNKKQDFFSSFNQIANETKSQISSVNSNYLNNIKNNGIFSQPYQSTSSNQNTSNNAGKFKQFQSITQNQFTKKQSPKTTKQTKNNSKEQNVDTHLKKQQNSAIYSSISSLSKQVYDTLNKKQDQVEDKKVQLMNFFDDQDQQPIVNKVNNKKKNQMLIDIEQPKNKAQNDYFNKTGPNAFKQLHHIKSNNDLNLGNKSEQNINFNDLEDKHFKTMPSEHSFIDLKGFIVQQVKKNAQQYFIQFSSLKFYGKVGFGHSSQVFKGEWRGREVAIKRIKDNMSPSNAKQFKRQIMTSVKIRHHPNLVTLIGIAEYQNQYYIINQFCNGATLFDFLHQSNHIVSIQAKINIAKQIAKGMLFLHTNDPPIIHRDLKSLNVLLVNKYNGQSQPQIKIADFGLSRDFASTYMTGTLGTYHWMAPQIFNNQPYSLKADVYSFAIVLWQILSRSPPYTNLKNPQSLMKFITLQNGRPDLNMICNDCPYQIKMLMIRCWDRFPQNRPNFKQILQALNNIQFQ